MRTLIAEDDSIGRRLLQKFLSNYGECDIAIDGLEAIDNFLMAINENKRYDLICLDIMMPKLDGMKVLRAIRDIEKQKGISDDERVKIIMTSALNDKKTVLNSYDYGCQAYAWKPIDLEKFKEVMKDMELI
jgi:two-component system chemotaxis response regulator CheY